MMGPKALDASIYMLIGGTAKGRLKRDSTAAETATWHIPIFSCGESALETCLSTERTDPKAGQGVRICDIPLEGRYGVFDQLPPGMSPAAFAGMLRQNAAVFFSTARTAVVGAFILP